MSFCEPKMEETKATSELPVNAFSYKKYFYIVKKMLANHIAQFNPKSYYDSKLGRYVNASYTELQRYHPDDIKKYVTHRANLLTLIPRETNYYIDYFYLNNLVVGTTDNECNFNRIEYIDNLGEKPFLCLRSNKDNISYAFKYEVCFRLAIDVNGILKINIDLCERVKKGDNFKYKILRTQAFYTEPKTFGDFLNILYEYHVHCSKKKELQLAKRDKLSKLISSSIIVEIEEFIKGLYDPNVQMASIKEDVNLRVVRIGIQIKYKNSESCISISKSIKYKHLKHKNNQIGILKKEVAEMLHKMSHF